jgi:ketosteroid isomerase-like protein
MSARTPEDTHALVETALNTGDLDGLLEVYEENAQLVVPPSGERVSGKAELREALRPMLALRPRVKLEVVDKLEADGLALTYGRWRLVGTDPDGTDIELAGSGTIVSRRQPDGTWLIVLDNPLAAPAGPS